MQPFAHRGARFALSHARLGLDRATRQSWKTWEQVPSHQSSARCLGCNARAIGVRRQLYSTNLPPKNPNELYSSKFDRETELKIEQLIGSRAEALKADQAKLEQIKADAAKATQPTTDNSTPKSTPPPGKELPPPDLPSWAESRRTMVTRKFSEIMDNLQSRALNASQTLNDITGYTGIEKIKIQNSKLEAALADAHERVRNARQAYKTSNTKRAVTQREVTTLLARKDGWSPIDLERFTELYRADHVLEGEVVSSQEALTEAEADEQSLNQQLNAGILKRYHEEQIWSDRIRRASTWGTWGLMGMNFVLFVVLQFVAEPWRRKRLVKGVVAEEKSVLEEVRAHLAELKIVLQNRELAAISQPIAEVAKVVEEAQPEPVEETLQFEAPAAPAATATSTKQSPEFATKPSSEESPSSWAASWASLQETLQDVGLDADRWRDLFEDLCSDRRIDLRMKDASLLALQGALAGAALTGSIALLFVRRS